MINWKDYSEKPTESTISSYPTLLDIVSDVVGMSERKHLYKYPLKRHETFYYDLDKVGSYYMMNDEFAQMPTLMPMSRTPLTFYRGQWKFYDNCFPTLYRYDESQLSYQRFLSQCQIAEMMRVMWTHPVIAYLSQSYLDHSLLGKLQLPIIYDGLAQHYGINTEYLDLTNNIWTAAFFASARWQDGEYQPIKVETNANIEDRFGVIYRLDYSNDANRIKSFSEDGISPIGLQYFNRPGRQCALVKKMKLGEDFNDTENLERIFFKHDDDVNRLIFTLCQFGKQFFPADSLVKIVDEIKQNNRFSKQSLELVGEIYYPDFSFEVIEQYANDAHFELTDTLNASFDSHQIETEGEEWFNGGKERYIQNILILPMLKIPIGD